MECNYIIEITLISLQAVTIHFYCVTDIIVFI